MHYVYILKSEKDKSYYTGYTNDLRLRIKKHNAKEVKYTSKKVPYVLAWYSAFTSKRKAIAFERYLKQGSGFSFARKHLL